MLSLEDLLKLAREQGASDLHLTLDSPPVLRKNGILVKLQTRELSRNDLDGLAHSLLDKQQSEQLAEGEELDFSFSRPEVPEIGRCRVNVFRQQGTPGIVIRLIPLDIPTPECLGLPPVCLELARLAKGLVLIAGSTGSGKSTTLASLIDYINRTRACHIVTIEDPIEYVHSHKLGLINQREVGKDTGSFAKALRAVLRQDPDVILLGEMRDQETVATAVTAAETGHLVFSTLHTNDAVQAVDRMIDIFPPHGQQQIRLQLAAVLQGIIVQQLLPRVDREGRVLAAEVLLATPAARSLIREGKTYQLLSVMQTNARQGMQTMDKAMQDLVKKALITGDISREELQGQGSLGL